MRFEIVESARYPGEWWLCCGNGYMNKDTGKVHDDCSIGSSKFRTNSSRNAIRLFKKFYGKNIYIEINRCNN